MSTRRRDLFDLFAVSVVRASNIIGHMPRKISTACSLLLQTLFSVPLWVADNIQEVLSKEDLKCHTFTGEKQYVMKVEKLIKPTNDPVPHMKLQPPPLLM